MGDTRHQQAVDRAEAMLYQSTLKLKALSAWTALAWTCRMSLMVSDTASRYCFQPMATRYVTSQQPSVRSVPAHQVPWPKSSSQAATDLFRTPPTQPAERLKSMLGARSAAAARLTNQRLLKVITHIAHAPLVTKPTNAGPLALWSTRV